MITTLFSLGDRVITPNALESLNADDIAACVNRHANGDWGELCDHDQTENNRALCEGGRLFSLFHDRKGTKFYVITECDRSVTTVLLPEDY